METARKFLIEMQLTWAIFQTVLLDTCGHYPTLLVDTFTPIHIHTNEEGCHGHEQINEFSGQGLCFFIIVICNSHLMNEMLCFQEGKGKKMAEDNDEEEQEAVTKELSKRPRKQKKTSLPPLLVFAHGAGAPSTSPWMQRWKKLLAATTGAVEVVTFDYPYCAGGKKGAPPKAEKLIDPHLEEIKKAQSKHPGHPLVLVGKSMGSRVSCMVSTREGIQVSAIICLGYPLKGTKGALRDEILLNLHVPVMFVQGSKDALCPLDKLKGVLAKLSCITKLHVIEGGDHSFKVGKKALQECEKSQEKLEEEAVEGIRIFLEESVDVCHTATATNVRAI